MGKHINAGARRVDLVRTQGLPVHEGVPFAQMAASGTPPGPSLKSGFLEKQVRLKEAFARPEQSEQSRVQTPLRNPVHKLLTASPCRP